VGDDGGDPVEDQNMEAKIINEGEIFPSTILKECTDVSLEYKTWKKNSPFLYDMILRWVS
jgi:hypothetical protein